MYDSDNILLKIFAQLLLIMYYNKSIYNIVTFLMNAIINCFTNLLNIIFFISYYI